MPPIEVVGVRYEATELLAARHWRRMVVNITKLRSVTSMELFVFAKGLASDLPKHARVALVVLPEQAGQAKLAEKVAKNDGVLLSLFFDAGEAMAWVKKKKPHEQIRPQQIQKHL
jgi:hypothetical protein